MAVIKWREKSHHKHHYISTYFNFGHQHVKFYTYDYMNNTTSWNIWCIITAQTSFHTEYFYFFFKYFVKSYIRIFFCTKTKIRLVARFSGLLIFNCRLKYFWHLRHRIWYCFDNYFTYFVHVFKYCYSAYMHVRLLRHSLRLSMRRSNVHRYTVTCRKHFLVLSPFMNVQ